MIPTDREFCLFLAAVSLAECAGVAATFWIVSYL
jgi:hypothetical protein